MKHEDYGNVSFSNSSFRRRHVVTKSSSSSNDEGRRHLSQSDFGSIQSKNDISKKNYVGKSPKDRIRPKVLLYKYNTRIAVQLVPALLAIYCSHQSPIPFIITLYIMLSLYALDLCAIEATPLFVWIAFGIISLSYFWEHYQWNNDDSWGGFAILSDIMLLFCLGCWGTVQNVWLSTDAIEYGMAIEQMLHSLLPLSSALVLTHISTLWLGVYSDLCPYIFAIVLGFGIVQLGNAKSSFVEVKLNDESNAISRSRFVEDEESKYAKKTIGTVEKEESPFIVEAYIQSYSILCCPTLMHIIGRYYLIDRNFRFIEELYDLFLIASVSQSFHWCLKQKGSLPLRHNTDPKRLDLTKEWKQVLGFSLSVLVFQYRYLIPIMTSLSHTLHGENVKRNWLVCLYFDCGMMLLGALIWFRCSRNQVGDSIGGDSHEEIFQFMVLATLISFGMAFPMPLEVVTLMASSFLTMWMFTRNNMLRYIIISSVVNGVGLFTFFSLRFRFVRHEFSIIPGSFNVSAIEFCAMIILLGLNISLVYGVIARESGGRLQWLLRKLDLAGFLLVGYSILLLFVEASLLFDRKMRRGHYNENAHPTSSIIVTGAVLTILSIFLPRIHAVKKFSATLVMAISVGKIITIITMDESLDAPHEIFLHRTVATIILILVIRMPYLVNPVRLEQNKKNTTIVRRSSAEKFVALYCAIPLPLCIIGTVQSATIPTIAFMTSSLGQYRRGPRLLEVMSYCLTIWGLTVLFIIRDFVDGGMRGWRKISLGSCILGLSILIAAPGDILSDGHLHRNPFSIISSTALGISSKREGEGALGLVFSILAIILSIGGPLRFGVDSATRGSTSRGVFNMRHFIFSVVFGSGFSWYATHQVARSLTQTQFLMTLLSCTIASILHTFSAVAGYISVKREFDEVARISKLGSLSVACLSLTGMVIDLIWKGFVDFSQSWYSKLLLVQTFSFFGISIATRFKKKRTKATLMVANIYSIFSWICSLVLIFGTYGVGVISTQANLFGFPTFIILTVAVSPLLCTIQPPTRDKRKKYLIANNSTTRGERIKSIAAVLPPLSRGNDIISIPIFLTVLVFIGATLYVILLRGIMGSVHLSHSDVIESIQGERSSALFTLVEAYSDQHIEAVASSSKLTACGLWTAKSFVAPIKHLCGLVIGPIYTWCIFYLYSFQKRTRGTSAYFIGAIAGNLIALISCRGIPSLAAAAFVGILIAARCTMLQKASEWKTRMSI
mmetsp:Transcript_9591/g.14365  ORF Transcript_9591/g.14365 Transcript_9591/m.14365 type:complete len:1234 (-) Transcript_9591:45-3746(-)